MKKQDMTIGHQYHIKYSELPCVLLAISGYRQLGYEERKGHPQGAVQAAPVYKGYRGTSLNLVLTLQDARFESTYHEYTEAMFLAGEPIPEGTRLIAVTSKEILGPWGEYVIARDLARKRESERKAIILHRQTKVLPKVKAELSRLGINKHVYEWDTGVRLSFDEFLALAARVPAEVTK